MAVGDIYQADVIQQMQGVTMVNVFHFEQTAESNLAGGAEQALATAIRDDLLPGWKSWTSEQLDFIASRIIRIQPPDVFPTVFPFTDESGEILGDPLQTTKAALATWYTDRNDGRGRGRSYFPGVPESVVRGGNWVNIFHGNFRNFVDVFRTPIQPTGDPGAFQHGVWSRVQLQFNRTVWGEARARVAQQRSRQSTPL